MIQVVIVDDHELVRTGYRLIIEQQADIKVVGEAADGEQGLALLRKLEARMFQHAQDLEFEAAAEVRDQIQRIREQALKG